MAFDYFVVLAEMRTGSNLLESHLNAAPGVTCHGELFNPGFIGQLGTDSFAGVTLAQRDADPWALLGAVRAQAQRIAGFRLFHDHDPRIWDHVLADTACAKIILTRNPLDSYVSRKIAAATKQWKLGSVLNRKQAQADFDGVEFEAHVARLQATQVQILNRLQTTGQTAFYIGYDDLNELDVINGLLRWLAVPDRLAELPRDLKKQNPEPVADKLANPAALPAALARIDRFDLTRTPNFEPRRGPLLDAIRTGVKTPLVFMPLRGGPEGVVSDWMAALDGVRPQDLGQGLDQGRLEAWRRAHPGHRSFAVLRHPLRRAIWVYQNRVLAGQMAPVAEHLRRLYDAPLADDPKTMSAEQHRACLIAFLNFAHASLNGQTGLQPWPAWASQSALLDGYAAVGGPDMLIREETMDRDLGWLLASVGHPGGATPGPEPIEQLATLIDPEVQALCRRAYARDYLRFGFSDLP